MLVLVLVLLHIMITGPAPHPHPHHHRKSRASSRLSNSPANGKKSETGAAIGRGGSAAAPLAQSGAKDANYKSTGGGGGGAAAGMWKGLGEVGGSLMTMRDREITRLRRAYARSELSRGEMRRCLRALAVQLR